MNGFFNRINLMVSRYLSNRLLMREQGILLGIMACMIAAVSFSSVFVNTFLYGGMQKNILLSDGIYAVVKYNMLSAVNMIVFCFVISIIAKKLTYRVCMAMGAAFHVVFYAVLIAFRAEIQNYIPLLALLSGISTAFFYICYNSLVDVMISGGTKKQYIMFQSIISVAAGIVLPVISGTVIMGGSVVGYTIVFALCAFFCVFCFFLCAMLPKMRGQNKKNYFAGVLIKSLTNKRYFAVSLFDVFRGLKEATVAFLIPVVLVRLSAGMLVIGLYVAMCAALGVLANFIFARFKIAQYPYTMMVFSIVILIASAIMLVFRLSILSVFVFGAVNALLLTALNVPQHLTYYGVLSDMGTAFAKKTLETTSVKEIYFNFGKILSIVIFSITMNNTSVTMMAIAAIFALQFVCWGICVACRKGSV